MLAEIIRTVREFLFDIMRFADEGNVCTALGSMIRSMFTPQRRITQTYTARIVNFSRLGFTVAVLPPPLLAALEVIREGLG